VLRGLLLLLSRQSWLRHWMETSAAADRLTSRFIAGSTLERELAVCQRLNRDGILATLDHLGENVTSLGEAERALDSYLAALQRIADLGLKATVSIKLTQLGLDFSKDECWSNVERLVQRAKAIASAIEVDMEASEYVDRTLELVSQMHAKYASIRAVVQAYLYRSASDVEHLCSQSIPVRLCKGAYQEPSDVAFPNKRDVDQNYVNLMIKLLDRGACPALATHDERILRRAVRHIQEQKIVPERFEFQMLYGVRRDLQRWLISMGYRLRLYVPYGDAWYPYFMRRLAERPANVVFLVRNLMKS
jgi:proline dehydrogenase